MEMVGAVLGVLIQRILPNWLYSAISGVVISFTAYMSYKKFLAVSKKENALKRKTKESEVNDTSCGIELTSYSEREGESSDVEAVWEMSGNEADTTPCPTQPPSDEQKEQELRKRYLEDDMRQYLREKIVALVVLWISLLVLAFLKGGKGVEILVGITCESPWYSVLIALQLLWMFGFALYFGLKLVKKQEARDEVRYAFLLDDPV